MLNTRFDIRRINMLKDILLRLRNEELRESIQLDIDRYFKDVNVIEILLIEQELINGDYGVTMEDVKRLSSIRPHLYNNSLNEETISKMNFAGHPVQVLKEENTVFQSVLDQINLLFESFENNPQHYREVEKAKQHILRLGEFHNHYNRKEKLLFPIMERYGHLGPARIMWKGDDRVRVLYKALKGQISQFPVLDFKHVRKTYDTFEKEFKEMIFQEEAIMLPFLQTIFHENDWLRIAEESYAFGYALIEPEEEWSPKSEDEVMNETKSTVPTDKNIPFGGGYLTVEEANHIFNNLPLEITFVDKNSVFKYFNEMTEASEMMLVRTPISIGRNVANCHPPKSLSKVMTLVRDLKAKRRTSESMWFKKKDQYVYITYKGLFNEQDEFLGILEYVQDIQPFLNLPTEVKATLSELDE